jgi:outer membrane protein assembly factor BamB
LLAAVSLAAAPLDASWPTESHDGRRTGQSAATGPRRVDRVTTFRAPGERSVNVPATVAPDGTVYFGTWGMVRSYGLTDRTQWHKSDGKLFALRPDLAPRWAEPAAFDLVPYCYSYPSRPPTPAQCPGGGTVNFYNGTVEGTAALAADPSVLYVGRGDGKLYALDTATGAVRWTFRTYDPEDEADPEGGGEIVAGPLVGPDGAIYVVTVGAGDYETNAVYAVNPDGTRRWRYPQATSSAPNTFWASPALSPDGSRLYVAGAWGPSAGEVDPLVPGAILAFDVGPGSTGTGEERLLWQHHPVNSGEFWLPTVWPLMLAVGSDGTLYASGPEPTFGAGSAVLFAITDAGDHAEPAWPAMVDLDRGEANRSFGLALREVGGVTTRVYATSGNVFSPLAQQVPPGGVLVAADPGDGSVLWELDPEDHGLSGALTGIAIGADGVVYTGVSGAMAGGTVLAVDEDGGLLWRYALEGLLEWSHPVLAADGALYVADTQRCLFGDLPFESGLCPAAAVAPVLYRLEGQAMAFHTLAPCRLLDTRLPGQGPALASGADRVLDTVAAGCGLPASVKALALNLTAVSPGATGHLTAWPAGAAVAPTSAVNFVAGRTVAGNAVLGVAPGGRLALRATLATDATVHLVVDVVGWFE